MSITEKQAIQIIGGAERLAEVKTQLDAKLSVRLDYSRVELRYTAQHGYCLVGPAEDVSQIITTSDTKRDCAKSSPADHLHAR